MGISATPLFDSIPREDQFNLLPDGVPNVPRVLEFLDYRKQDVAVAANIPVSSVRYDRRMPKELQERFTEWAVVISLVANFLGDEHKTILWFKTPNPLLGNVSPKAMIRAGRCKKLLKFIQTALSENLP